jgi:hypothetical protein
MKNLYLLVHDKQGKRNSVADNSIIENLKTNQPVKYGIHG